MSADLQAYQERISAFNPNEHLMQIPNKGGKTDYLPVQWRLVWFREQCPDGTIETEMVLLDLDRETEEEAYAWNNETRRSEKIMKRAQGIAIFRATVRDGKGGIATGTKSEKAASFADFIEKAETGAIGRALAALGYGTQFAPELNEEHRIVDAPVERRPPQEQDKRAYEQRKPFVEGSVSVKEEQNTDVPATDQQIASIRKLHQHLGKPEFENAEQIGYLEAKQMIGELSKEYREAHTPKPLLNGDGSVAQPKKLLDCYSDKLNALLLEFQRLQPQWCAKHSVWHMDILRSVLTIANDQPFPARFNEDDEHRFELYVESKREKVATSGK